MKGSIQIVKLFGIPVRVHWSFGLLILGVIYMGQSGGVSLQGTMWMVLFFLSLFVCVVLHEFGHALSARHYGVKTHDIVLSPIGGIARLDKLPEKPFQEFIIAIAGPLVNLAIAALLAPYVFYVSEIGLDLIGLEDSPFSHPANFLSLLFLLNISLAVFNLLPAFPMDGGRIFRALLSTKFSRTKATQIATYLGQAIAIVFLTVGIFNNDLVIAFIGVFVFFTAASENRMVKINHKLSSYTVGDLMRREFAKLKESDGIAVAVHEMKQGLEKYFLVFDQAERLVGMVSDEQIRKARESLGLENTVGDFMQPISFSINPGDSLKSVFYKMQQKQMPLFPVMENNKVVGVIDIKMMKDFLLSNKKITSQV
ncbi:MAG TPA: site-2 protease family protein [Saprospiraceae bacterium]|nr:site-2 protease family protein [Saprospiraceae bacterium]